jgi:hypothetical protein
MTHSVHSPSPFFSLTEYDSQLSLVIDELSASAAHFPQQQQSAPKAWRAIQIWEGADAINATGIVSFIAAPLARDGYNVLYISMYNSDLILVEEDQLDRAIECVRRAMASANSLQDVSKLLATPAPHQPHPPATRNSGVTAASIEFDVVPAKLQLGALHKGDMKRSAYALTRLFLCPARPDRFFSFTLAAEELSVVVEEQDYLELRNDETAGAIVFHKEAWSAMEASVRDPTRTSASFVCFCCD